MTPLISVLLPVYNGASFLNAAIDSILQQTFTNFELIIINDGSTDDSQSIIDSFDDTRIRVYQKPNSGLIDSLNLGISYSRASWIARMDADDIAMSDRLETQYKYTSSNIAVIGSQAFLIDESNTKYGRINFATEHHDIVKNLKNQFSNLIHPSVLINKVLLEKVGGYDSKMHIAEDFDLWLRISKVGTLMNIDKPLLYLRKHGNNVSSKLLGNAINHCMVSICYYYNSDSYLPMSQNCYDSLMAHVSSIGTSYKNKVIVWENVKEKFPVGSLISKLTYISFHPFVLYHFLNVKFHKKILIFRLKKNIILEKY